MSYHIEEKVVATGHNLHVWVEHEAEIELLLEAFEATAYVKQFQIITPLAAHAGRFPSAVFAQVPSALYAKGIRTKVAALLGVHREVFH